LTPIRNHITAIIVLGGGGEVSQLDAAGKPLLKPNQLVVIANQLAGIFDHNPDFGQAMAPRQRTDGAADCLIGEQVRVEVFAEYIQAAFRRVQQAFQAGAKGFRSVQ
jgi:hypothetical protein